jgi:adenylate cyclase
VWGEKYDGSIPNVFEIQDQITRAVTASTNTQTFLTAWQLRRLSPRELTTGHKLAAAAMGRIHESTSEAFAEGARMAEQAIALEPGSYLAHVARAAALLNQITETVVPHNEENVALVLGWASKAVELGPRDEICHWIMAWALAEANRPAEAVAECERGF